MNVQQTGRYYEFSTIWSWQMVDMDFKHKNILLIFNDV